MKELYELLRSASIPAILLVELAYFAKVCMDKQLTGLAAQAEEMRKISLQINKDLLAKERRELVALRVAITEWEHFLQTPLFHLSIIPPAKAQDAPLYAQDNRLFLNVKVAVVKTSA